MSMKKNHHHHHHLHTFFYRLGSGCCVQRRKSRAVFEESWVEAPTFIHSFIHSMMGISSQSTWWFPLILSGTADEAELIHNMASTLLCYISPVIFVLLYAVLPSPSGKLTTSCWGNILGPVVPARWAWFLFEVPNLLWVVATVWVHHLTSQQSSSATPTTGENDNSLVGNYILLGLFTLHYLRRTIWYPWRMMSSQAKPVPLAVILSAVSYTSVNG